MIFKCEQQPFLAIWDITKNTILCKFNDGLFETNDLDTIKKIIECPSCQRDKLVKYDKKEFENIVKSVEEKLKYTEENKESKEAKEIKKDKGKE